MTSDEIESQAVRAFYAVANETLQEIDMTARELVRSGDARMRISVGLGATTMQQHVVEQSGAHKRLRTVTRAPTYSASCAKRWRLSSSYRSTTKTETRSTALSFSAS